MLEVETELITLSHKNNSLQKPEAEQIQLIEGMPWLQTMEMERQWFLLEEKTTFIERK